jgi:hypothetical protein
VGFRAPTQWTVWLANQSPVCVYCSVDVSEVCDMVCLHCWAGCIVLAAKKPTLILCVSFSFSYCSNHVCVIPLYDSFSSSLPSRLSFTSVFFLSLYFYLFLLFVCISVAYFCCLITNEIYFYMPHNISKCKRWLGRQKVE